MFTCIRIQNYREVWGHALPEKFDKLNALRLSFWDRSSAVVATWSADYCIQFSPGYYPCIDVTISQLTSNFDKRK